jgi:hypothetical protein
LRSVDGEIVAGEKGSRGDQRDDTDHAFHQHRP